MSSTASAHDPLASTPAAPTVRVESEAILAAFIAGAVGAVVGLIVGLATGPAELWAPWRFGVWAAFAGALAAAVASALGYWRSGTTQIGQWMRELANWRYIVSTVSVVVAHAAVYFWVSLAFLAVLLASLVAFVTGFFSLTAFEIIVFALIFGWLAVFIRFLGVAGDDR